MSKQYMVNVPYLEISDFDGMTLKPHVTKGKPVVMMIQGVFCGYCSQAKPAFEQFAHTVQNVSACTVQIDGQPEEKKIVEIIQKLYPAYQGVPIYLGFDKNGRYVKCHQGGRDIESLMNFASSL